MVTFAWLILWIPFIAACVIASLIIVNPKLSASPVGGWIGLLSMLVCFGLSLHITLDALHTGLQNYSLESSLPWIHMGGLQIEFGIAINGLSLLMLMIVTGIGSLIFLYSIAYMYHDSSYSRYFASLSLFAFSMLGIVLSNNLIQTFIFWELVGLSSYLLIGFWYEKKEASTAGKKAFLTTRVGDVGMMIGILLLFTALQEQGAGSFNFLKIQAALANIQLAPGLMTAVSLLIFLGVVGKSAQVPLHVWLPDAMEGPTPVSALIHAATMVAAGVFLLARLFFIFSLSPDAMKIIAWTGAITSILPGLIAVVQTDIKKILAYSTLSQLGYMVMAIGLGNTHAGMFHLTTHAFFKALLFLGAGSLIHAMHTQNIWEMPKYGPLLLRMPVTSFTFLVGTVALMGVPPTSGFFSKEEIIAQAFGGPKPIFIISLVTVFLTAFYMSRLCTIVFFTLNAGKAHGHEHADHPAHESSWLILFPLLILGVLSVAGWSLPLDLFLPQMPHEHHAPEHLKNMVLAISGCGFFAGFGIYLLKKESPANSGLVKAGLPLNRKFFFDDLYDALIQYVQEITAWASAEFENHIIVRFFANGTAHLSQTAGRLLTRLQNGLVQFYTLLFATGVTLIIYVILILGRS